jgi:hypothetical protein
MFKIAYLQVDYKNLEIIKNALANEIESLENQNFADIEKENIEEHKQILNKVNKKIKFILGDN